MLHDFGLFPQQSFPILKSLLRDRVKDANAVEVRDPGGARNSLLCVFNGSIFGQLNGGGKSLEALP